MPRRLIHNRSLREIEEERERKQTEIEKNHSLYLQGLPMPARINTMQFLGQRNKSNKRRKSKSSQSKRRKYTTKRKKRKVRLNV